MKQLLGLLIGIGVGVSSMLFAWHDFLATSEETTLFREIFDDFMPNTIARGTT